MKGSMHRLQRSHRRLSRTALTLLLVIQALGGGAVTLAHARDVVTAPAHVEANHDVRCPVLHDALRCALCHYAGAQVVVQQATITPRSRPTRTRVPADRGAAAIASAVQRTSLARAPPTLLS
jgi:hypothetical protein